MVETDIYELIECMTALIRSEERKKCTELYLQPVHFQILNYLSRANKHSDNPAALARYLGMTRGTVSQSLIILEKKGYIEKIPDKNDKRFMRLRLLPEGATVLKQARPSDLFDGATEILRSGDAPPSDVNVFQKALIALQKANQSQSFGVCKTCRNFSARLGGFFCELTQQPLNVEESKQICQEHKPT